MLSAPELKNEVNTLADFRSPSAVILAAGSGTRLRREASSLPKPLVVLRGLSLAERSITQMLAVGVNQFFVVLGSDADRVRCEFELVADRRGCRIDFAVAEDWQKGNGASAAAVQKLVGNRPFLLTMVDHLVPPEMIRTVLADPPRGEEIVLAVDFDTHNVFDVPDLTKVQVIDEYVAAIGKDLENWNAGDTGLFYCTAVLFDGLWRARKRGGFSLSDGIRDLVAQGRVRAIDVSGECWLDVDTPQAFREAMRRIDESAPLPVLLKDSLAVIEEGALQRPL